MNVVIRTLIMYLFIVIVFRLAGKRSMVQMTTFDFVLVLVLSETTQQALVGDDYSLVQAFLAILTFIGLDILFSLLKQKLPSFEKLVDGKPTILVDNGQLLKDRMDRERVDKEDILASAREKHGLERMDQIKYAVLECSGGISIIPKSE